MGRISAIRDICYSMFVAHNLYTVIPRPCIRSKLGSPLDVVTDESPQRWCRQVRDLCHANSTRTTTTHFRGDCNDCLSISTSTANLGSDSSEVFFIYFNGAGQLIPSGAHHSTTQFMKPIPCSIITAKAKDPFQSESAGSVFLTRHKPHSKKPRPKRFVTAMKQCSSSNGRLPFTFSTKEKTAPHQRGVVCFFSTTGANKPFRPSKFRDICNASIIVAKPLIKFLKCSRIINARNRVSCLFHDRILHLVAG